MGKDLKGNSLPTGIRQRKNGVYRGRFKYKGEMYSVEDENLKKVQKKMADLRYEVEHGLKGKGDNGLIHGLTYIKSGQSRKVHKSAIKMRIGDTSSRV